MFVLGLANGPPTQWLISPEQLAGVPSCSRTTQHNSTLNTVLILFGLLGCFDGCVSRILSVDQQLLSQSKKFCFAQAPLHTATSSFISLVQGDF